MAKEQELGPIVVRLVESLKGQQVQINELKKKMEDVTDSYLDGVKDGIEHVMKKEGTVKVFQPFQMR